MQQITLPGFDYTALDTETRIVVQQRTNEIKTLMRRTAQDIIDIGAKLIEVKGKLEHGQFGGWLKSEFGWEQTTAWRFMRVSEKFCNLQDLEIAPSALYLLAAPSTPDEARDEAIERAQAGEVITHATAQNIVTTRKEIEPLDLEDQKLVLEVIEKTAPAGRVTPAHIKSVVNVVKEVLQTGAIDSGDGEQIPVARATPDHLKAAVIEETYERLKRQEEYIKLKQEEADRRRLERVETIQRISEGNTELPVERPVKFPVIYADPPWRYEHVKTDNRAIENHYPTMDLPEICALPVSDLATPDAVLFMWATSPKLAESMKVIEAWGFNYRTCMVWVKDKIGMGYYARQRHELLLIATRGSVPVPEVENRFDSVVEAPRLEHSAKPARFYEIIEAMYPEYHKIELFARNVKQGWHGWGNQYGDVQLSEAA